MTRKLVRRDTQIIKRTVVSLIASYVAFYYVMPAILSFSAFLAAAVFTIILWVGVRSLASFAIMVIGVMRLGPSYSNKLFESLAMELRGLRRHLAFTQKLGAR